jgi:hypothetical protein
MQFSPDDDPAFGQWKLFPDLGMDIPSPTLQGWSDVFGADIAFGKRAFIHWGRVRMERYLKGMK